MDSPDRQLAGLTEIERAAVERFAKSYASLVKRAPRFRDTPPLTDAAARQEAIGIALRQLDKYVADYERELSEKGLIPPDTGNRGWGTGVVKGQIVACDHIEIDDMPKNPTQLALGHAAGVPKPKDTHVDDAKNCKTGTDCPDH